MAGPIRISILADAKNATAGVKSFAGEVESSAGRVENSLGRVGKASLDAGNDADDGFKRAAEGADDVDTKAMGFRDTLTGVQDTMKGTAQIAKGDLAGGLLSLGMGVGDLASGFANFLIPMLGKAAGAMKALNLTMLTNPVFLVIAAIAALVAIFIIAYKRSETFRRIVNAAFRGVLNAARAAWNWIKRNWPMLLAIITGPIGLAVRWVVRNWDRITAAARAIPRKIRAAFSGAGRWLVGAGRAIVMGLWNGITGLHGWLIGKVRSFIAATVPGPIRRVLGLASPSKVTRQMGRWTAMGLGLGIDDERARVRAAADRLAGAALPIPAGAQAGPGSRAAGGRPLTLFVEASDSDASRWLASMMQEYVRVKGRGNVQLALGTR